MLAMQNTPADVLALPGVVARELPLQTETAKFDLTLHIVPAAHGLECAFEFNADLFDTATIMRWRENLSMIIDAVVATPSAPLAQLPMLPEEQFNQVVRSFGQASSSAPAAHVLLHGWFEQRAATAPLALAMVHGADTLTYAALNRRANQLAHYLIERGVCRDDRVAVLLAPGIGLLIGILGVLKSGAAYVPCDPAHPQERLAYILADSGAVALVADAATHATAQQLVTAAPCLFTVTVEEVADQPSLCDADPDPERVGLTGDNLAYVIYTSGSTGRPKGVMVEHGNAANLLQDWSQQFGNSTNGQAFQAALWTSPGFDVSVFEIFVPLALGGTLRPVPYDVRPDAASLMAWLLDHDIAFAYLAPFVIRHTAEMTDAQLAALRLKNVLVGVEALMESDLYRLEYLIPGLAIVNAYGPTEITVYCTTYTRMRNIRSTAPIGRPITNAAIYLLDVHLAPVAQGVIGEIYIGGKGVARGYLNRPDLTADRFLADPFAPFGGRMYRSGDLGRWDSDGQLHYIGRNDFQLKLRGYRVEPGEIEACLRLCDGIADAAVIAHGEGDAKRLVAYVVALTGTQISVAAIRAVLSSQLADFMIPAAFVALPRLPLNASGKLDRFALPAPDASAFGQQMHMAPIGAVETELAALWCTLLDVTRVGRDDNFLTLGGHSLALTKLRFLVKERFGVRLEVAQLYELQELHQLASHIEARQLHNSSVRTTLVLDFDDDDDAAMEAA
ncbi:amino acid adenylation domain-containing protein [Janthinobacterium lividum]|nr:amino acid adenylation domain-containing protein [Janthinobacterium lividum]